MRCECRTVRWTYWSQHEDASSSSPPVSSRANGGYPSLLLAGAGMKQQFILAHDVARQRAIRAVQEAPAGFAVTLAEPRRNLDQNAKFHAICSDIARSGIEWAGKRRTAGQWKVLLVSGHAVATKEGAEMVPGLEGEFVNVRESTALMSVKRSASLIEYTLAFCAMSDVRLSEPERQAA